MKLVAFRVQMYKCVLDSGWIEIVPLTALVGKNEAGKTSLLKALHKFNPYNPEPYSMDREWPRGHREKRHEDQVVCTARFKLDENEISELSKLTDQKMELDHLDITRDYGGRMEVLFPKEIFPDTLHPNDIDNLTSKLVPPTENVGQAFREKVTESIEEARRKAREGRFGELASLDQSQSSALTGVHSPTNTPQYQAEARFVAQYTGQLRSVSQALSSAPSIQKNAHDYIISHLPTFIYMSDYQMFHGSAQLDQVKVRKERHQETGEDKTLLMLLTLSGLDLDQEVAKGNSGDREQRQYDLDDASETLTRTISDRWKQRRYEVQFRADGQFFYTFVKDEHDPSLIRLEERSKGFQWFFSFDLMFMHESNGTFQNCVILLDEPGLHLHPDAQRDLLKRMEEYAAENVLIYTTHLPFMIDLRKPDRIRALSETASGTVVTEDLNETQPEAKFVLQAALGMSGSSSYLISQQNVVVEGVDDFWIITELSNLLVRSGEQGLPEEAFVTPAGGASEATYIATFMVGQKLDVVVLFDTDKAGRDASDALIKKWLTRYGSARAEVLHLGDAVGSTEAEFSIEDFFPEDYYLKYVHQVYRKQLESVDAKELSLRPGAQLCKRVEAALEELGIKFNKGSISKLIRAHLSRAKQIEEIPNETAEMAKKLMASISAAFAKMETMETIERRAAETAEPIRE